MNEPKPLSHRPFAGRDSSLSPREHAARCLVPEAFATQKQHKGGDNNNEGEHRRRKPQRKDRSMAEQTQTTNDGAVTPAPTKGVAELQRVADPSPPPPRYGEFAMKAAIATGVAIGGVALFEGAKYGLKKWVG